MVFDEDIVAVLRSFAEELGALLVCLGWTGLGLKGVKLNLCSSLSIWLQIGIYEVECVNEIMGMVERTWGVMVISILILIYC